MTRAGAIAAAFRVFGGKQQSTSNDVPVKIVNELLRSGKISVVDSKAEISVMKLKIPPEGYPRRIYWEGNNICFSYPFQKVSIKYMIVEKDMKEILKNVELQIKKPTSMEKLSAGVVLASAMEFTVKLVSEMGTFSGDPVGWLSGLFKKPNVDLKVTDLGATVTNLSSSMGNFAIQLAKVSEASTKTSNDVKELLDLIKSQVPVEKKGQDGGIKRKDKHLGLAMKGEAAEDEEEKMNKGEDEAEKVDGENNGDDAKNGDDGDENGE